MTTGDVNRERGESLTKQASQGRRIKACARGQRPSRVITGGGKVREGQEGLQGGRGQGGAVLQSL